nr:MAG: capsid protein [Cressdnaviricota sp.]
MRYAKRRRTFRTARPYKRARTSAPAFRRRRPMPTHGSNFKALGTSVVGFPKRIKMTHRYTDTQHFTVPIGAGVQKWVWGANYMYDPDVTSTGHQPMWFDQMSALYNHFTVIASKITIRAAAPANAVGQAQRWCLIANDDGSTPYSNLTGVIEDRCKLRNVKYSGGVSPNTITMSEKFSAKKIFGGSVLGNPQLQGTPTSDPAEGHFFMLYFEATDATQPYLVDFIVDIEYIAIWDELKDIAQS